MGVAAPRRAGAAIGLVGLLALTGCGGGGTGATVTRGSTVTVTETAAPAAPTTAGPTTSTPAASVPAGAPASFDEAVGAMQLGEPLAEPLVTFRSPSGNIFCTIAPDTSANGCELTRVRLTPHEVDLCDPELGEATVGRVVFLDGRTVAQCNTDTFQTPDPAVLEYGRITRVAGGLLNCLSRPIGMTCVDTDSRHGFFISTDGYKLF